MQEDVRRDFVTSQPAAGALFTVVLGELCDFLALRPSGNRLKGALRAAGTAISALRPRAQLAGSLRRTWPSTRTAPVTLSPLGQARAVAARQVPGWLLGDEEGLVRCHVSLVKRGWDFCSEFSVSRLHQDVWPRVPAGDRVGALRQPKARGWWPAHSHRAQGVGSLPAYADRGQPVALRETLSADPCLSWCECVAKANHRDRGVMNATAVSGPRKPRNAGRTWRG